MARTMVSWRITEKVTNVFGEVNEYYVGWVDAVSEQSALNKARKQFKVDTGGIPYRRRNPDNFCAWNPLFMDNR